MMPLSYIEISRRKLVNNAKAFRSYLGLGVKIAAVIKANAYGHGQNEVAKVLESHVDYFQVDDLQELILLRKVTEKSTLVLGYVAKNEIKEALANDGIICIYDKERLKVVNRLAGEMKMKARVHIKIDACLGRQGLLPDDLFDFFNCAKKFKNIIYDGIYAHFANLEDTSRNHHALKQIKCFSAAVKTAIECGFHDCQTHISATAGALIYEKDILKNHFSRIGIGLYGMWPSEAIRKKFSRQVKLEPVLRWVTQIAQIKTLPKNHTIGYGLTFVTKRPTRVAIIPQGYSDGYDRGLSNRGDVLIGGKRCPVLGRVAMNMFVVDVSRVKNVKPEDKAVLLGGQKNERITAEEIADKIDTINYEITTRISPLLRRIIV